MGTAVFSVIGDDRSRSFVICGGSIQDIKYTRRVCLPGDIVLCESAWQYCVPSHYEYVLKDADNVKIIKVLEAPEEILMARDMGIEEDIIELAKSPSHVSILSDVSVEQEIRATHFRTRVSVVDALRRRIGMYLRSYMVTAVLMQIDNEQSLAYLIEIRNVTVVCISIIPFDCTVFELISLTDEIYKTIQNIIESYSGLMCLVNLFEKDISFIIIFGLRSLNSENNNTLNGVLSACQILKEVKHIIGIKAILIGVSCGLAFCGIIGHIVRRQFMVFGHCVDMAISLMMISYDKIYCDYNIVLKSTLKRERFRRHGIKTLRKIGKCQIYEILDEPLKTEVLSSLEYKYPLLGRLNEIEYFKDLLDEIGISERRYSGLVIEGIERSGKSRILDAYVTIVKSREIKLVQLPLHPSFAEKSYSVIYHILLQIFNAENCISISDREKVLINYLSEIVEPENLCYLNYIMRVQFPKSNTYCEETDWQRYKKMIDIFEKILNEIIGSVCILLDDVHYMDPFSWQFLSAILSNKHIVLVMTMLEPVSWDTLTQIETGISQEKRLKIKSLNSLNAEYLAAFACQFLNVIAIPETLERILSQHSKNGIGWCEAFLMSILQVKALDIISISPQEVQKYNLVFPDPSFLSKIPVYLTPEELAPPLQWMQMTTLNVCVPSKKPKTVIEANRDVIGLRIDIYNRMNSYEQDFIKCAAALGDIFHRNILSNVISNSTPLYTSKAVAEMIRLRILECAMVQRKYYINMTTYHAFKKRKTFSNMHHLVFCDCMRTRPIVKETLPVYADCRVLEFTISSYRKFFYDILSLQEKNEYHTKAINILEQSAKKCSSCGRGPFLIPLIEKEEKLEENMHRDYIHKISERFERRRSIFVTKDEIRKDKPNARIASVVPTIFTEDNMEEFLPRETKEESLVIPKKVEVNSFGITYDSLEEIMKSFTFMDNRSCTCMEIISYIFWQISQHIYQIKDIQPEMFIKFTMEYSAGLIQTGQSLHAIKFLMNINEDINEKNREKNQFENIFIKEQWLILIGDAYIESGNYSEAKKYYTEAVILKTEIPQNMRTICYNIIIEKLRYTIKGIYKIFFKNEEIPQNDEKVGIAIALQRFSMISMVWKKHINEAVDLLFELYYTSGEDVDYSATTWYYALCLEFLLDASMNLESYSSCNKFYTFINTKLKTCVSRDPTSLLHLNNALLIWQLRMNVPLNNELVKDIEEYVKDVASYNFSEIYCSIKGLESYLLILYRRLDIPQSYDLFDRTYYAKKIIKFLHNVSIYFPFVKPFTYFLESYMRLLRGRKSTSQACMAKAEKYAIAQGNKMVIAWIEQNKRTWEVDFFNNMAEYWVEFVASSEGILWQEIHLLKPIAWSTILYPYPHPKYNY